MDRRRCQDRRCRDDRSLIFVSTSRNMTGHLLVGEGVKPNLNLPDSEGNIWSLDDHAGRTVVLIFHRHIH